MVHNFKSADRGHVRAGNDSTMEARARSFTQWLGKLGFDDDSLSRWDHATAAAMVSTFTHYIANHGNENSSHSKRSATLSAQTLIGYARAAECWCAVVLQLDISNDPNSVSNQGALHPFILELASQRRAWQTPRDKKEAITLAMLEKRQELVLAEWNKNQASFLSRPSAVHAFVCLGLFTGSRVGEYGQTKSKRGHFNTIPISADAGDWAGMPIAFIRSDFTFWSENGKEIAQTNLERVRKEANEVYIRFRYDKSLNNFTIRKFKRTGHDFLCPVLASAIIILRANMLKVPSNHPIGAFRLKSKESGHVFISNTDVTDELRETCKKTYPDPEHYMHLNHSRIMAHSIRVTAAVALHNAGQSYETIAFRLRWSVQSVQHYIRESCQHIGDLADAVLMGAGRL
jgi:hypothetical protein